MQSRTTDLWRAEPCFEIRSLHVLRSSTLLPSVLRADWASKLWDPPLCPGAVWREVEVKSSPESSVYHPDKLKKKLKTGLKSFKVSVLNCSFYLIQPACEPPLPWQVPRQWSSAGVPPRSWPSDGTSARRHLRWQSCRRHLQWWLLWPGLLYHDMCDPSQPGFW